MQGGPAPLRRATVAHIAGEGEAAPPDYDQDMRVIGHTSEAVVKTVHRRVGAGAGPPAPAMSSTPLGGKDHARSWGATPLLADPIADAVQTACEADPRQEAAQKRTRLASYGATMDPFARAAVSSAPPIPVGLSGSHLEQHAARVNRRLAGFCRDDAQAWLVASGVAVPLLLLSYSSCVSYAQLICTGSPVNANIVTAMHVFASGLTGLVLPLRSQCPLIIPSADITVTLFYSTIVQDIVRNAHGLSEAAVSSTALLALPVNTVLLSIAFWWVGYKKATVVISYLPYPVVAGFLGSIGWAIFAGSFAILAADGQKIAVPGGLPELARQAPAQLACAVGMASSSMLLRGCQCPPRLVAVAPMTLALFGFWCCVFIAGLDIMSLRETGWLFPAAEDQPFWEMWTAQQPDLVDWPLLVPQPSTFAGLGMVLMLSLTLRVAGIEGSTGVVLDVDEEVKWTGVSSAVAGLCGGVIGSHSPGLTTFNQEAGMTCVRAALLAAIFQLGLWFSGVPAMNFFPRFLLAGILMNLGLVMLVEWMWTARRKVGKLGLLVIYAQVASSAILGLLPSVLIGVAAACGTAQAQLMTLHVLKYHVSGCSISSYVRRSQAEALKLSYNKDRIEAIGLEGFLAEGPMIKLGTYLRRYIKRNRRVRYMIIDFKFVQGTNASACALLSKLDKTFADRRIHTVYTNIEEQMAAALKSFGVCRDRVFEGDSTTTSSFQLALKDCEDRLLASEGECDVMDDSATKACRSALAEFSVPEDLEQDIPVYTAKLAEFFLCTEEQIQACAAAGKWSKRNPGHLLTSQGHRAPVMQIGVPGFSEVVEMVDVGQSMGPPHQVSVERFGVLVAAESALYDEPARSTFSVSSSTPSVFLALDREYVQGLAAGDPDLYGRFARHAAKQLLRRCDALGQAVELNKGGGWRGATFDRHTAEISASLFWDDAEHLGKLGTPTVSAEARVRRRRPASRKVAKLTRKDSIVEWASRWLDQRQQQKERYLPSPTRAPLAPPREAAPAAPHRFGDPSASAAMEAL